MLMAIFFTLAAWQSKNYALIRANMFDTRPSGIANVAYLINCHVLQLIRFALSDKIVEQNDIGRSTNILQLDWLIGHWLSSLYDARSVFVHRSLRWWRLLHAQRILSNQILFIKNKLPQKAPVYWRCQHSMRSRVYVPGNGRASVRLSVPSIDNSNDSRRVCCWAALRAGDIDRRQRGRAPYSMRAGAQQQMRVASCWQPTEEDEHILVI